MLSASGLELQSWRSPPWRGYRERLDRRKTTVPIVYRLCCKTWFSGAGYSGKSSSLGKSSRAYLPFNQRYESLKQVAEQCAALLNEIEGEPINVDICETIMGKIIYEPAEYVPV